METYKFVDIPWLNTLIHIAAYLGIASTILNACVKSMPKLILKLPKSLFQLVLLFAIRRKISLARKTKYELFKFRETIKNGNIELEQKILGVKADKAYVFVTASFMFFVLFVYFSPKGFPLTKEKIPLAEASTIILYVMSVKYIASLISSESQKRCLLNPALYEKELLYKLRMHRNDIFRMSVRKRVGFVH